MYIVRQATKYMAIGISLILVLTLSVPLYAQAEITLWSCETTDANRSGFDTLLEKFYEENPNVKVEVTPIMWPDVMLKGLVAFSTGAEPDMMIPAVAAITDFWKLGAIQPVDEIMEQIGEEDFFKSALEQVRYEGHYLAVPFWNEPGGIFYKKTYFEEKGLKIPETWDEWVSVNEALTEDLDGDGTIDRYGLLLPGAREHYPGNVLNEMLWKNGSSVWTKEGDLNFDRSTVEALDFYVNLMTEYSSPGSIGYGFAELYEMLGRDEVASEVTMGHAMKRVIEEYPELQDKIGVFPMPTNEGFTDRLWVGNAPTTVFMIFRSARHKEEIAELILFLMRPENIAYWCNRRPIGQIPVTKSALNHPTFWENPKVGRHRDMVQTLAKIVEYGHSGYMYYGPHPLAGRVYGALVLTDMIQKVIVDGWSSKQAVEWGAQEILRIAGGTVEWVGRDYFE